MQKAGLRGSHLSIQQAHLWKLQWEDQPSWVQCIIRLDGSLDNNLLHLALADVVRQNEILRTVFHRLAGMAMPLQVINAEAEFAYEEYDLQDLDTSTQQARTESALTAIRTSAYDPSCDPALHATLLKMAEDQALLLLSLPALCADSPTLQYLMIEVVRTYTAHVQQNPLPLNDEILQYADVSTWQNEILEDDDARIQQAFWVQKDLSPLDTLRIPFSHTSLSDQLTQNSFEPRKLIVEMPGKLSTAILACTKQLDIALDTFFLTGWQILLWRLSDSERIPVGVACDGRNYEELAHALGLYTRSVPLIADLAEDSTLEHTLAQVHSSLHLAKEAQIYFSRDLLAAHGKKLPGDFFPLSFAFEQWPAALTAENVHFTLLHCFSYADRFTLKFAVQQSADTIQCELDYDATRMQPEQVQQVANALLVLLQAMPAQLQTPISRLPILAKQEQEQLLQAFRGPEHTYTAQTLQQLFAEQVEKHANDVAVICEDQQLTYEQLNTYANRLASWLICHGIGPDVLVCLCIDRGIGMLVSLLAVLKAGGAYVPLDPDLPASRLVFQLEDTQASILLTQESFLPRLSTFTGQVFCLDRDAALLSDAPTHNPPVNTDAHNLAYVIYTSGSTGTPKGVQIQQKSIVNYTCDMRKRIAPTSGLHFATVSTLAADLGNTVIFTSLASGGCLHILSYETLTSGEAFASYIEQRPIDVLKIVPSHLQALLASCGNQDIAPRKYLILGGETLTPGLLQALQQRGARCHIINHYGPTETTIGAVVNELGPLQEINALQNATDVLSSIPIGYPISNVQVCIVDRHQQLVPAGISGELLIGGAGVAAGYLHQPELELERFLPHPILKDPHVRVYRTGDLACYTADGLIEFRGRVDRQVKLRGYRIELSEIEIALRQHPQTHEAVVVMREDSPIEKYLAAYIVPHQPTSLLTDELRHALQKTLPEYMIPTFIIQLPSLPLTKNGKIDYQALPSPEQQIETLHTPYRPPRSPLEETLVVIWQAMLRTPRIGIDDNFFAIGGHSLLVTQVISRIKTTFQINIPIARFFDVPTVAGLAELIESMQIDHASQPLLPTVTKTSRDQDLPLSFSQQRLWFLQQLDPHSVAYNVPFAIRIRGALSIEALEYSLGEIMRRHEILRTTFLAKDEQPLQHINPWHEYRLESKDLRTVAPHQRENEVQRLSQEEAGHTFDLLQGPLLRGMLLSLDEDDFVLLLTRHHIISDGWSSGILLRELQAFYTSYIKSEPVALKDLTLQYADYASWQREWLQGEVLDAQLHYWTQQLAGIAPLNLPTDYQRPVVQSLRGAELHYQLAPELVDALKHLSLREGATLFMLLLAAFQTLLARYSGQDDIAVGTSIANRNHAGTEDLIGPFINTLVLRTDLSGRPTVHELLQRVRKVALEAYAHQDLPFEKLVEALQPERDLSRSPLFQVMFDLQNMPMPARTLSGLQLDPYQFENTTAKFDLLLTAIEQEQGLYCVVEYNTDLFAQETIERMLHNWQTLLQALLADPLCCITELPLIASQEQALLQSYSDGPQAPVSQRTAVHVLFEEQVHRTPEGIAVIYNEHQISYQELNRRANHLAHYLQTQNVGPETQVALLAERDIHFLTALLAVLKAGGTYLPLDPLHPTRRVKQVLKDSDCQMLLVSRSFAAKTELLRDDDVVESGLCVSCIEDLLEKVENTENLSLTVLPHQLAYIIYTSGSTGMPKGVMIEHEGMLNHLHAKIADLQLTAGDSVAQTASQCFDISVWQLLAALLVGGRVDILPDSVAHDPAQMWPALEQRGISICEIVPSLLNVLLDGIEHRAPEKHTHEGMRYLLVTGEAMSSTLCRKWFALQPGTPLINAYGPTECSDDVTHYIIAQSPDETIASLSIGYPLANTQIYILDQAYHPVPLGVYGEIYVGGLGVGRGYFGDPQRTAQVFVPDPFDQREGARLYKTGDKARYRTDGTLEFLGRIDYQVKIHGFRIELGEIEALLRLHPDVQEAIVIAHDSSSAEKELIAYVVVAKEISTTDLRNYLKERLPYYMLPAAFQYLATLPLTSNGKVDRWALPVPDLSQTELAVDHQAPRTPVEVLLVHLWEQVLGQVAIGIADNFFTLGGHSLLAMRMIAQIRDMFQIELPLRSLFEAPTIGELAQHVEAYQRSAEPQHIMTLKPVVRPEQIPLSFAQQRLWFLDQLEPDSSAYTLPTVMKLTGPLSLEAFEQSIQQIVLRHESLRTTFASPQETPVQIITEQTQIAIPLIDLSGIQQPTQQELIAYMAHQEVRRSFDLIQGPLLRLHLLRLQEEEYIVLLSMHHIISDGWSSGILVEELNTLYRGIVSGSTRDLPALPIQYADYAIWQREWLQGARLQEQLDYWQNQLADVPLVHSLPLDQPRPAVQTYMGERQTIILPLSLRHELEALSRREGVTLFMTLLTSFQILLMRYSGQTDIVVGTSVANRRQKELENLIGFFVNMLALRSDLSGNPTFQEALARVREMALQAYAHQDLPFEQLIAQLALKRDLSHQPLFQIVMEFQNASLTSLDLPEVSSSQLDFAKTTAKFDLELMLTEIEQGLLCTLEYDINLFEAATIERLLEHFQVLLHGIVADPTVSVWKLPLLAREEREKMLSVWNNTSRLFPQQLTLHEMFEAQAASTPDAIALVYEQEQLTYAELDRRANRLAHFLQYQGVGPEVRVGICIERTLEMMICLLSILKAGGAYVPLDPFYPVSRLEHMLTDSEVTLILTQEKMLPRLVEIMQQFQNSPYSIGCLDEAHTPPELPSTVLFWDSRDIVDSSDTPCAQVDPIHLAYIMYTSGSTGLPKGVPITHTNLVSFFNWVQSYFGFNAEDRIIQYHSLSFDFSVWEIFEALLAGACLCLVPSEAARDVNLLTDYLSTWGISVLNMTPSQFDVLTDHLAQNTLQVAYLRTLVLGGEALNIDLARKAVRYLPAQCRIFNEYGPTETTISCSIFPIHTARLANDDPISIGSPLDNTQLYVLDSYLQPVPIGVAGELFIGGVQLSPGYLHRPEFTAERFIPDPFNNQPGTRLYKTGDLVHYLLDGTIEYLGRLDQQVKLRGYRIELEEIQGVLHQHPAIQQAVVVVREDVPGDKRLVAYYVSRDGTPLSLAEMRTYISQQLPDYMLPAAFVQMVALPVTLNGKLDLKALPLPEVNKVTINVLELPRTPDEEVVASIMAEMLGIEQVGISDNFFELGGHSLLATRVIARVRETFQLDLPLRTLFEAPTVREFTQHIEALQQSNISRPVSVPRAGERPEHIPLSFAQQRLWFLDQLEQNSSAYNIPNAIRIMGSFSPAILEDSIQQIVQRHESLRTTFTSQQGIPIQVITSAMQIPMPLIDLSGIQPSCQEEHVRQLAHREAYQPFYLAHGPLLRIWLLRLREDEHILLLCIHHIAFDGWSWRVLVSELTRLYQAAVQGKTASLPSLPVQYADYTLWQRQWLQEERLQEQLDYWRQQLANLPPLLSLPTDRPRPQVQSYEGATYIKLLPLSLQRELERLSQREGVTLFMTLLTSFQVLLMRYSGQTDIVVGTPVANRTQQELEELIGFFVNTLVIRSNLSGNPSFRQALARVREVALQAYANQDLPFERLVEELQPERDLSRQPLFQVMFILLNMPRENVVMDQLAFQMVEFERKTSKFDISVQMRELEEGLEATVEYCTDLFDDSTIQRIMDHWQRLLQAIVSDLRQPLSELPLLSQDERKQMIVQWNQTQHIYAHTTSLHCLFEEQVARTPESIAAVFDGAQLSYAELNRRANQVAYTLQTLYIGPDMLVGICMERSLEMIIALLGTLKAGAAYVPMDPGYPQERLIYMLQDAQVSVVLAQNKFRERGSFGNVAIHCLDTDWSAFSNAPTVNPKHTILPEHLAYMIYTSGSTGQPKGVMNTHQGICNRLQWIQETYPLTPTDRVLQKTPYSFDVSAWEFFWPLLTGASLVLATPGGHQDPKYLREVMNEQAITTLHFVPAMLQPFLQETRLEQCPNVRQVICSGEALSMEHQEQFFASTSQEVHLYNLYGPTEASIEVSSWECQRDGERQVVPIGYPISNIQLYVLDPWLQPVPMGVAGELYIAGVGLARGYHHRADLTAEMFLPNPFSQEAGARMYRTGDMTRYQPDGAIEYLGRIDNQVKVRGFRIEPGEIEAALHAHPAIQESIVIVREHTTTHDKQLVAYLVPVADTKQVEGATWEEEHVGQWQMLYNDLYRAPTTQEDPTLNIVGWNSSYTGQPLAAEVMLEQVEQAASRILTRAPQAVMEVGCGTGMLLFRIAPHTRIYAASDFSGNVLRYIEQVLATRPLPQVHLSQQAAHEAMHNSFETFDTIILNSIVQYFPGVHYLLQVLTEALALLEPGGFLFLGDIRNKVLHKAYMTSVELYKAPSSLSKGELRQRVQQRVLEEEELLVDPAFFHLLQRFLPQIGQVQIFLKRGHASNELTRFRYDVIVRKEATEASAQAPRSLKWGEEIENFAQLQAYLQEQAPDGLHLREVPNMRMTHDLRAVNWVFDGQDALTVDAFRKTCDEGQNPGIDPEDLWVLGEQSGYRVNIYWSEMEDGGVYDVSFQKGTQISVRHSEPAHSPTYEAPAGNIWLKYTNNPLQGKITHWVLPQLRDFLKERLPDYMIPAHFVALEHFPLTASGKIDRKALPAPEINRNELGVSYRAPRNPSEEMLASLWSQFLGIERIGIDDNFFQMGGHSLLATRVIAWVREMFQVEVPLRTLFEAPTISDFIIIITQKQIEQTDSELLAQVLAELEQQPEDGI